MVTTDYLKEVMSSLPNHNDYKEIRRHLAQAIKGLEALGNNETAPVRSYGESLRDTLGVIEDLIMEERRRLEQIKSRSSLG